MTGCKATRTSVGRHHASVYIVRYDAKLRVKRHPQVGEPGQRSRLVAYRSECKGRGNSDFIIDRLYPCGGIQRVSTGNELLLSERYGRKVIRSFYCVHRGRCSQEIERPRPIYFVWFSRATLEQYFSDALLYSWQLLYFGRVEGSIDAVESDGGDLHQLASFFDGKSDLVGELVQTFANSRRTYL